LNLSGNTMMVSKAIEPQIRVCINRTSLFLKLYYQLRHRHEQAIDRESD
jgi:hypothetical protein